MFKHVPDCIILSDLHVWVLAGVALWPEHNIIIMGITIMILIIIIK